MLFIDPNLSDNPPISAVHVYFYSSVSIFATNIGCTGTTVAELNKLLISLVFWKKEGFVCKIIVADLIYDIQH